MKIDRKLIKLSIKFGKLIENQQYSLKKNWKLTDDHLNIDINLRN